MLMKFAQGIDQLNRWFGKLAAILIFILVIVVGIDVLMRYVWNSSKIWVLEVELYLFAFSFLLGAAYTLQKNQHVRVDVFYQNMSTKWQNRIDIIGALFYLLPWSGLMCYLSWSFFQNSYAINEGSSQAGGLPFLFIMKFGVFIGFFLLFLQGISLLIKTLHKQAEE